VVRALGAAGQRVLAAAAHARPPAALSRYVWRTLTHPHPASDPAAFVEWLDGAVGEHRPDCVLPLTECSIQAAHRHLGRFAGRAALALPPADAVDIAFDKARGLTLAESLGGVVPAPWGPTGAGGGARR
jgi:hypothetical protein